MTRPRRHRTLAVLVVGTVLLLGLDLTRPGFTSSLRTGSAAAFGPLERALTVGRDDDLVRLTRERDALVQSRRQDAAVVQQAREVTALLASPAARGARLRAARVVAFTAGTSSTAGSSSGERRVTIDAGSRDGVTRDLAVIAGAGLVGRVIAVAPWTSDVLVVGDRDLVVGVRAGKGGRLGSLSAAPPAGARSPEPGRLRLTLFEQGSVRAGDPVTTLGSAGGRPYPPDIPVGTVVSVDPDHGQPTSSAVVEPVVDTAALDVVAVVLPAERAVARAPAAGPAR